MASSPSIASTRSTAPVKPGFLAEMLRLWLEHNRRVAEVGMPPL